MKCLIIVFIICAVDADNTVPHYHGFAAHDQIKILHFGDSSCQLSGHKGRDTRVSQALCSFAPMCKTNMMMGPLQRRITVLA